MPTPWTWTVPGETNPSPESACHLIMTLGKSAFHLTQETWKKLPSSELLLKDWRHFLCVNFSHASFRSTVNSLKCKLRRKGDMMLDSLCLLRAYWAHAHAQCKAASRKESQELSFCFEYKVIFMSESDIYHNCSLILQIKTSRPTSCCKHH